MDETGILGAQIGISLLTCQDAGRTAESKKPDLWLADRVPVPTSWRLPPHMQNNHIFPGGYARRATYNPRSAQLNERTPRFPLPCRTNASLCQWFPAVFFMVREVRVGYCGCGVWPSCAAGGEMAAREDWAALLRRVTTAGAGVPAADVGWRPGPGVACPKSPRARGRIPL